MQLYRCILFTLTLIFFCLQNSHAQDLFTPRDNAALDDALSLMGMTQHDFGFEKDVAEPDWYFDWSKTWLTNPRKATISAQSLLEELSDSDYPTGFIADTFERPAPPFSRTYDPPEIILPPLYENLLKPFCDALAETFTLVSDAFSEISPGDRRRLACAFFSGLFAVDESDAARKILIESGCTEADIQRWESAQDSIDPRPEGHWNLQTADSIPLHPIITAVERLHSAMNGLRQQAMAFTVWPEVPLNVPTGMGDIIIGTTGSDIYLNSALLILDPGGDDQYRGQAGAANGLRAQWLATILDLDGHDRYRGQGLLAPGAALFGISMIRDESGDDVYEGVWLGAGAAAFGGSVVHDSSGNDTYRAQGFAQAAGHVGIGYLEDGSGNDIYDVGFSGQGFAGFKGLGLLVDRQGHDLYKAGGVRPDYERHDDRFLSLAQGFAIGVRPWAGGGRGVLVDLEGDDRYIADIYGQGVGYWYSAGMLVDVEGNDQYSMFQYGQGAGIHLSLGLLADLKGRDQYTGYVLTQGSAHDYAVGILIEGEGDDTYVADHFSQGRAMNNSLAILLDRSGRDGYFSRQCDRSQGIGNNADLRDYGSLALIVDLAGKDQYSCGGVDNQSQFRPDFGHIYDREFEHEK